MYANNAGTGYANANIFYLFLGAQPQWGLGNPSINFPIAFPKECFIAAITRAAGNYEHSIVITTKNKTNLSWICKGYDNSAGNTYANWLALGCQLQWGVGAASTNIMLPIPYTKVKFITLATSSMLNPSQGNISVAYHDSTLDSIRFQIRWQGLAAEYTGAWLTLGI